MAGLRWPFLCGFFGRNVPLRFNDPLFAPRYQYPKKN